MTTSPTKSINDLSRIYLTQVSEKKENPYSIKNKLKMAIKSVAEKERMKAGVTREEVENIDEKCWDGYEKKGMKTMFGKRYPNCVKKEDVQLEDMGKISHTKTKKGGKTIINVNPNDESDAQKAMKNDPKYILGKTRVQPTKEDVQVDEKVNLKDKSSQYARSTKEVDTAMTDHVNRTKGRHYGKDGKVTEVGRYRRPSKKEARKELVDLYKKEETQLEDSRLTSSNDMQSKMYAD